MRLEDKSREELLIELDNLHKENQCLTDKYQNCLDTLTEIETKLGNEKGYNEILLKALPIGVYKVKPNGFSSYVNEEACHIFGLSKEEMLGTGWLQAIHPEDREKGSKEWERIIKNNDTFQMKYRCQHKDGRVFWVIDKAVPYIGEDNEVQYAGTIVDVTELERTIVQLKHSETKFRSYIDRSPDGIFITDETGRYIEVNPASCLMTGYTKAELLGKTIKDLSPGTDLRNFKRMVEFGETHSQDTLIRKDGRKIIIDINAVSLGNSLYIAFVRDITEQKQIEKALILSEEYNDLIINGVTENLMLYELTEDDNFRFLKVNDNFLRLLKLSREEVIGKTIQEVISEDLALAWINNNRRIVQSGENYFAEEDGDCGTLEVRLMPLFNNGVCTHLLGSSRNISDKKMLEEQMVRVEKLESVGLLAGGIAHDFNNILTAISGNVALAKMKIKDSAEGSKDKITLFLHEAEKASLQAKDLTQQLLTFAKGGSPIIKTTTIRNLLTETATFALRGSNVRPQFLIPEDLWPVKIDEGQINQVIHNLVANAIHAMPNGGEVVISAQNIVINRNDSLPLSEGKYVQIAIQDNGVGIPQEYISKIFDPYFTTNHYGSGLGLATSYSIVKKHEGFITVKSKSGLGTTIYVYLPASEEDLIDSHNDDQKTLNGKGKVLVMDDEKSIRYVLGDILDLLGYESASAKDGKGAIELYVEAIEEGAPFDAVIMDLTIPGGMGGKETLHKLLGIDPHIKAIVSSGYSNDPVMAHHTEYGFMGVVAKPFSIEVLGMVLQNVIKQCSM